MSEVNEWNAALVTSMPEAFHCLDDEFCAAHVREYGTLAIILHPRFEAAMRLKG